jgi:dipeptidase E
MKEKIILLSHYSQSINWLVDYLKDNNVKRIVCILDAKTPKYKEDPNYNFKAYNALKSYDNFEVNGIFLEEITDIKNSLVGYDAIFVIGGNTFYLLNAMRNSGFNKVIKDLVGDGVIYIGESAGSYVACPTIEMAHWKHQDADIVGMDNLEALNLIPYLVTVHYKEEFKDIINDAISKSEYGVKTLTDYELIVRENGRDTIINL